MVFFLSCFIIDHTIWHFTCKPRPDIHFYILLIFFLPRMLTLHFIISGTTQLVFQNEIRVRSPPYESNLLKTLITFSCLSLFNLNTTTTLVLFTTEYLAPNSVPGTEVGRVINRFWINEWIDLLPDSVTFLKIIL